MLQALPTVAEIAIVIAGFVGLAVAIRPSLVSEGGIRGIWLRLHIAQTLILVFLCLVPILINEVLKDSHIELWRVGNGIMAVVFSVLAAWRIRAHFRLSLDSASVATFALKGLVVGVTLSSVVVLFCTLSATGLLDDYASAIYFTGILAVLLTSCFTFILLLFSSNEVATTDA